MNVHEIHISYKAALGFLASGQLKNAFEKTKQLVQELQIGEYADRLDDLQQNYRYLLHYYITGVEDPQRKTVFNKLISKEFILVSELREELLYRNSSNFEYTQKRYFPHTKRHLTTLDLFESLQYYHKQSTLFANLDENHDVELKRLRINYEACLPDLFRVFWLGSFYNPNEKLVFNEIINTKFPGKLEKMLIVSALTLNLWRTFDENKLSILFDCCISTNQGIKQRALVGLCFVLLKYNRYLPFFPSVRNRLVLLIDDYHIVENFQNIIIQVIATAETDKISKKMQEEILPEMMKISPLLKDKLDEESLLNSEEWGEENPAWQEILEKSGVSDKLQELNEMQLEGADVYMSTFSMLKSFPFFLEFSNWFLPFDGDTMAVNQLFKTDDKTLLTSFVSNNIMCNSDKYSFCLSILQMPDLQREMLKSSFKMEAEQLEEMRKDEELLTPNLVSKNASKQYIQDLFRFFKLHPQHTEFVDIFKFSLEMHRTYLFDMLSKESDFKLNIAEYYFSKNHYNQALELFEEIQFEIKPTAALYQKIGYSYQQTTQLKKALEAYLKADIIQPDDIWTIRKLALCYRLSGDFENALVNYQLADSLKPNQSNVLLQIGNCYHELHKYKEALNVYFKLDAEEGENPKIWRAIIWSAFVSGSIQHADYYMNKLLELEPTAYDYLNAGHVAWCMQKISEALELYRKCINMLQNDWELFLAIFNKDKAYLIENGKETDEIMLLLEELNPLIV